MNTGNRKNLFILSFTLLVVMLGYGMVMPIMPFYIEHFGAGGTELGWLMSTYSLMQLICAPVWGILSDRYGRKPIFSTGGLGYAVTLFMFGIAKTFLMLFIARSLSGILFSATMPTAMAYIGDNTPAERKKQRNGTTRRDGWHRSYHRTFDGRTPFDRFALPAIFYRIRPSNSRAFARDISPAGIKTRFARDGRTASVQ